jgi:hypothetical protein
LLAVAIVLAMANAIRQDDLFHSSSPPAGIGVVNDRCLIRTQDDHRVVLGSRVVLAQYVVSDPMAEAYAMVKAAILHRKNAYFYRTENGARVGDQLMSLIQTRRRNGGNPFEYLTALQRHAEAVRDLPGEWLPWNYRATLAAMDRAGTN